MRYPRAECCRRAVMAIPVVVALAASGAAAQDLRATDSAGNLRAFVGLSTDDSGLIELYNAGGRDTVELFSDDAGGTILLRNSGGEATVSLANGETGGNLFLADAMGQTRASIGLSDEGNGLIELSGSNGEDTVELFADEDGGNVFIRGTDGTTTGSLTAGDTGGDLSLSDTSGIRRAFIGVADDGSGLIQLYDAAGEDPIQLFADDEIGGAMFIGDAAGTTRAFIGGESGVVEVRDADGTAVVRMTNDEDGGLLSVADPDGETKIGLYVNTDGNGVIRLNGETVGDLAEVYALETRTNMVPGTVVAMHPSGRGLQPAGGAYDPTVVGVISGAQGLDAALTIGSRADGSSDLPVAMTGRAYVRVAAAGGPIKVGDLLVAADEPGLAMRADDRSRALGAVIGKALENYVPAADREGYLLMLVMRL